MLAFSKVELSMYLPTYLGDDDGVVIGMTNSNFKSPPEEGNGDGVIGAAVVGAEEMHVNIANPCDLAPHPATMEPIFLAKVFSP